MVSSLFLRNRKFCQFGGILILGVSTGLGNLQRDTGIVKLDSAGLLLCEISTWPKIILKYSCTVSQIIFHIVSTGLSHSGNRGQWLKLNGGPKTFSVGDFAETINKVERGHTLFGVLRS